MAPKDSSQAGFAAGQKYFALGLKFAGGVVLFALAGVGLDRWSGLTPLFTIVGTLGGAVLSFLSVYWRLMADQKAAEDARRKGPPG